MTKFLIIIFLLVGFKSTECNSNYDCGIGEFCRTNECVESLLLGNKCNKVKCEQMESCEESMWYVQNCEVGERDKNGDLMPCSNVCIWFDE